MKCGRTIAIAVTTLGLVSGLIVALVSCGVLTGLDGYDVVACRGDDCGDGDSGNSPDAPVTVDGRVDDASIVADGGGSDTGINVDAATDGGPGFIYATAHHQLWRFDIAGSMLVKLPSPTNCNNTDLEELAIDKAGVLFATNGLNNTVYRIDGDLETATNCVVVGSLGTYPFDLAFVNAGVATSTETLVGYMENGDYVRIDRTNGAITMVQQGALGARKPSGDLAAHGTTGYLSATGDDCLKDCLLEVDLTTGNVKKKLGEFPSSQILALAYAKGRVYGFSSNNGIHVVQVAPTFSLITTLELTNDDGDWRGAASISDP